MDSTTHAAAGKALEVIRLIGHTPEVFEVKVEGPGECEGPTCLSVARREEDGPRRSYELDGRSDWAFQLETDLKAGYFGPT